MLLQFMCFFFCQSYQLVFIKFDYSGGYLSNGSVNSEVFSIPTRKFSFSAMCDPGSSMENRFTVFCNV